ncbi:hypothetical protein ACFSBZ_03255 [Amnibacterium flavum]|uniref:Uncharacterized protein n=1 Tax=Amnibacterium flavum TaxID=2173173 RepID=A0A2V1HPK9_9MICO|nr:hypothetical protein [Amnibacterium flavum]PVZ94465.1 hypothetical protein DDQ50_12215 [Amnibacterium flavum]
MTPREGQLPPPDHEDKPVFDGDGSASVGERLTGVDDPKDPDGLLTLDDTRADPEGPDPSEVEGA